MTFKGDFLSWQKYLMRFLLKQYYCTVSYNWISFSFHLCNSFYYTTYYYYIQVYYTPAGQGLTLSINSTITSITLSDLVPGVEYSINVTAFTTTGGRISSSTITVTTCELVHLY